MAACVAQQRRRDPATGGAGEEFDVLPNDQPIARIVPLRGRATWRPAVEVLRDLATQGPPDPSLRELLAHVNEQTTDDLFR